VSLKQTVFSAGRWTAASTVFSTVLQLAQTMVLARLLLPADFGLMSVAAALLAVIGLFADLGLSRALIHFDRPLPGVLSSLYWLNLGVSLLMMFLLVIAAPALGLLYKSSALAHVLQAASLMFPLTALGQQFRVMAEKELRFSSVAANEIAAGALGFCVAIPVALVGGGVYALVAGMLATAAVSSMLAWLLLSDGHRPSLRFHAADTHRYLRYGGYMVGENFANVLNRQADVFVGGLVLGPAAMGPFSLPRDLSLRTGTIINQIITRVGFPVMARVQNDPARLRSIYLQTLRMTASVNFPVYVALALFADEVVALLYGPQWRDAGRYLQILALWGLVRSVGQPIGNLLYAVGMARQALWWNLAQLLLFPPLYWLATRSGGLYGLAVSLLVTQVAIFLPAWRWLVLPACGASLLEFLRQTSMPLLLASAAGAVAALATAGIDAALWRLLVGGSVGALCYVGLSFVFNRRWVEAMIELTRLKAVWKSLT
jgi:O-antigen/teichoic acid export membrane protein